MVNVSLELMPCFVSSIPRTLLLLYHLYNGGLGLPNVPDEKISVPKHLQIRTQITQKMVNV